MYTFVLIYLESQARNGLPVFRISVCVITEYSKGGEVSYFCLNFYIIFLQIMYMLNLTYSTYSFFYLFYLWYVAAIQKVGKISYLLY